MSVQAGEQSLKTRSRLMKIHCGSPLLFTWSIILESVLLECLQSPILSTSVSAGVQVWTLGPQ